MKTGTCFSVSPTAVLTAANREEQTRTARRRPSPASPAVRDCWHNLILLNRGGPNVRSSRDGVMTWPLTCNGPRLIREDPQSGFIRFTVALSQEMKSILVRQPATTRTLSIAVPILLCQPIPTWLLL